MSELYWLLISSALVFLMQAGFLCLESGRIRSKNSINVAAKNISDFIVSSTLFWLFGFAFMFGDSLSGLVGASNFFFGDAAFQSGASSSVTPWQISFFLFQMMFCGTAATLTSGAVAERMTFKGYLVVTLILSAFIYPVVGHWVWRGIYNSGEQIQEGQLGWLEAIGFIDFAGSTVVHSVGGWVALAAIIVIGPRLGRFDHSDRIPQGSNLPLSALGVLLIWLGWFGFNGGSTLSLNRDVPVILLNTFLSAVWSGLFAGAISYYKERFFDVGDVLNGVIAGLVGITAGCHLVSPSEAAIIGAISGLTVYWGRRLMTHFRLDDALDVVPAHLLAGIWGTLSVALFGDLATGVTRSEQFFIQLLGITSIGIYCFGVGWGLMVLINKVIPLRASEQQEEDGLNVAEHNATTELFDLLRVMQYQEDKGDFSQPVPEEPFTEVGQIARKYNQVIKRVNQEIGERDQALSWFRESEMRKTAILNSSMDCIVTIDNQGNIIEFNPAAERTFGCLKKQVRGNSFIEHFVLARDQQCIRDSLAVGFSSSNGLVLNRRNSFFLQRDADNFFPAEIAITRAHGEQSDFEEFTLHIRDVTRQQKLQERLRFLAYSDPLTSLYNRTYLVEQLGHALDHADKKQSQVALLFLDLDKFKNVNDTLGHKAGDELLCEVARRLTEVSDEIDVIARWGGDEFVFMMAGQFTEEAARAKAEKILNVMREPVQLGEHSLKIPTSIGIALARDDDKPTQLPDGDKLIQQADIAMYWAKQNGRDNAQMFAEEMACAVTRQFAYEQEIGQGLKQGQFYLVYQPKVFQSPDQITGLEALIRWQHPERGLIPPGDFIPVAEESSVIIPVSEWVIDQALKQLAQWQQAGLDIVPVAINLSGRHLISDALLPYVAEKLKHYQIAGELLEFEITEGVLLQDIHRCIEVMTALKAMNIRISVDDFGTGYSSLSYLKRLPLDILKIDQSFVEECDTYSEDYKICETIIHLATNLDLVTVAEGVETAGQADTLTSLGCQLFQGYHFYKPVSPDKVESLLQQNKLDRACLPQKIQGFQQVLEA
ncbi:ammonium transporter [Oceanospirillum sediminis]|uniref:Ammonium transporter n=1 Tax=Oceanospirillum sediminis TaxID=2760088 RepID=A0A839IXC7_9GAMM|nr:ammonium transporter [Oceanospirillum sediminis]MBB1489608.1 ammonium transporter [Oceanospirillum sediminis]